MIDLTYRDIAIAPIWAGTSFLIIVAAWRLARRVFPDDSEDQIVVHSIVVSWAVLSGAAIVLGVIGVLSGISLIAVVAIVSGLFLYYDRRKPRNTLRLRCFNNTNGLISIGCKYIVILTIVITAVANGLGNFPSDGDTLMYHLSRIDQWIESGSLFVADCYNWSHPGNNELLGLWFVAPFSGDFLISLNNLPAAGLLGFASISLGKSLGLSNGLSLLTAAVIVSNSVVFRQLLDAKNDVAVAGLFLACLAYGLRAAKSDGIAELVWGGFSIGILAGAKYNALGYALLSFTTVALIIAIGRGLRTMITAVAIWSCCLIFWGGVWYIRNTIMIGNPFFPMGFTRESNILAMIYPDLRHSSFWGCGRFELLPLAIDAVWRMTGPAHLVAILAVPVTIIWLVLSGLFVRNKRCCSLNIWSYRALALWIVGSGFILLVTPFSIEDTPNTLNHLKDGYTPVRFGLCFLSIILIASSLLIQALSRGMDEVFIRYMMNSGYDTSNKTSLASRRLARLIAMLPLFLWGAIASAQFITQTRRSTDDFSFHLSVSIVLLEGVWLLWLSRGLNAGIRRLIDLALVLMLGFGIAGSCGSLSLNWHQNYVAHYDLAFDTEIFSRLLALRPQPKRICVLYYQAYPFHGSRRQVRVFQPMLVPSVTWLLEYLRSNDVDLLIVSKASHLYPGWKNYDAVTVDELRGSRVWHVVYEDSSFVFYEASIKRQGLASRRQAFPSRP